MAIEAVLAAHPILETAAVYWVFSAAISSMPQPGASSGNFYKWLYGFSHTLAGDLSAYLAKSAPEIPQPPPLIAK